MKTAGILIFTLGAALTARADFSYTTTRKGAQGAMAAAMGPQATKNYFKGQKMKADHGDTATIIDFEAQTVTTIDNRQKTYTVMNFADMGQTAQQAGMEAKIDVKETGQRKTINGFNASETLMTMEMENPESRQAGMKMQAEMSVWTTPDVPGGAELRAFYQKNAGRMAMAMGGAAGMQKAMSDMQRKISGINGVPVLQVIRIKPAGAAMPQMSAAQQAQMQQAMAQLEAMKKQGGPGAAAMEAAMARMGAASGGGGALMEITMESSDFSTASIPDSIFAIPAGYQKK